MPRHNDHETPFYIRTIDGQTFQVDTLGEALAEFLGSNGYRLSLKAGDTTVVIRRGELINDTHIDGQRVADAHITVHPVVRFPELKVM